MYSFPSIKMKLSSCQTEFSKKVNQQKGVNWLKIIVFVKMKDSSVYSFREPENSKINQVIKKEKKQKIIDGRKMEELNRVYELLYRFLMKMMDESKPQSIKKILSIQKYFAPLLQSQVFLIKPNRCFNLGNLKLIISRKLHWIKHLGQINGGQEPEEKVKVIVPWIGD